MVILAFVVHPHLENEGIQLIRYPADRTVLFRQIRALVKIVRCEKISCTSSNPMPLFGFERSCALFRASHSNRMDSITLIPSKGRLSLIMFPDLVTLHSFVPRR